jgi:cytochrome c peroxidase
MASMTRNTCRPACQAVTGNPAHRGLFQAPSLRNIALAAPYMHDGRFKTLEEVLDH